MESADKPGSVVDNHSSGTAVANCLKQPTRKRPRAGHTLPYLVLLRMGFTLPRRVATRAVRSYRTISPLPAKLAVYFLWHFPWAHAPQVLPGILPAGARTFLPLARAIVWPTPPGSLRIQGLGSKGFASRHRPLIVANSRYPKIRAAPAPACKRRSS